MAIDGRQVAANAKRALKGKQESHKITRDAFLYLDPKPPNSSFGNCQNCLMWTGPKYNTCTIHGADVKVDADDSCGFYLPGGPTPKEAGHEVKCVTKKESGFVGRPVRCENCISFDAGKSKCKLFATLNEKLPDLFDLVEAVHPQGCCNAQEPRGQK